MTSALVSVFITCGGRAEADRIAQALVTEELAACVNIIPGVTSVYRWKGETHTDPEFVLLAKTQARRAEAVCARVEELHSYENPCVVVLPLAKGSERYTEWVAEQTGG